MDSQTFRRAAHAAIEQIIDYFDTIQHRNVLPDVAPDYLAKLIPDRAPETGEAWDDIQKDIETKIMPGMTLWQSPKFMAYFPAAVTYPSVLGELYSAALTAPAFSWICSPAITELEIIMMNWLVHILHLPACFLSSGEGGGAIEASASVVVATVAVAARERYLRRSSADLDEEKTEAAQATVKTKLVVLASESAHSSIQKAAMLAGARYMAVPAGVHDAFRMTGTNLRAALEQCDRDGLEPFLVCATYGTTSTCAVDDFEGIAAVLKDYPAVWGHIDAAYAGAALVCEEYQGVMQFFEAFDSFNFNMNKWLLTNLDASCFFVKRRSDLTDTFTATPPYMRNGHSDSGHVVDYRNWGIALTRRFRSLKVWFVVRTYGVQGMQAYIRHHLELGQLFQALVASRPDLFQIFTPPAFALTVFYVCPRPHLNGRESGGADLSDPARAVNGVPPPAPDFPLETANVLTAAVAEAINGAKEYFLTTTVVGGRTVMRVVSANPKAEAKYVRGMFDRLVETTQALVGLQGHLPLGKANGVMNGHA
ncbi:MAG: hypothetical protein M1826_002004 [Phylliscum demangeonii]|nr:MAG: hypothetical protein M1826_002004 [Phylliscum demangeonii]